MLQTIESNVFTPRIQQHQVNVSHGVVLAAQLLMRVMAGMLGVVMATPLTAVLLVCVKELYVTDVLERSNADDGVNGSELLMDALRSLRREQLACAKPAEALHAESNGVYG